jgi:tetratricopeptide (TPR) repeat protein
MPEPGTCPESSHQRGRTGEAIAFTTRALRIDSGNAEYHANLSAMLLSAGRREAALQSADHSIAAKDSGAGWFHRGRALSKLNRPHLAVKAFEAAAARAFCPSHVLLELGDARQAAGDLAGSAAAIEESLRLAPEHAAAWLSLSRLVSTGDYCISDLQMRQMHQMRHKCPSEKDASRIAFALAACHERRREYAAAFEHWRLGNDHSRRHLQRSGHVYDAAQRTRRVNALIEFFTAQRLRSLRPVTASRRALLIVGMPRSGTSLIEQILASHPDVAAGGELPFWNMTVQAQFGPDGPAASPCELSDDWRQQSAADYLSELNEVNAQSQHVVDKMPGNYLHLGFVATAFPQATIIHCCRDPRDACLSNFAQLYDDEQLQLATSDLDVLAHRYYDYCRLMRHWNSVLPARIMNLSYERLVMDPDPVVRELLSFCGLPWSDRCLQFHHRDQSVSTASAVQVRQPLYQTSRGRWTHYEQELRPLTDALSQLGVMAD